MMMLKGPLQLYTTNPILTYSDQLGSKILGNYHLMSLSITPQDLLHITMQEPEIYVEQDNGGSVLVENHISNFHQDNLEFMNQFINRIMLVDTPQFTYQDEVFVSTVLQKLGITNVSEFISQVRETTQRTELLQNLVNRYFEEETVIKQTADRILQKDYIQSEKQTITQEQDSELATSIYMMIAKRLHIAENNNILYEYTRPTATGTLLNHTTMTLLPLIEQADMIELQQLRNELYRQTTENVMPQLNAYETIQFKQEEVTQKHVTEALNAAILLNLIKDVRYEVTQSLYADRYFWQDYKNVLYGNAMDTFKRFEQYQQMEVSELTDKRQYIDYMNRLYQDEYSMVEMLAKAGDYVLIQESEPGNVIAEHAYLSLIDNQSLQQILTRQDNITNKLAQNIFHAGYDAEDIKILENLKEKEEVILALKQIAREKLEQITLSERVNNIAEDNVLKIETIRQYLQEKEQDVLTLSSENIVNKYIQILTDIRKHIDNGKYIDDINSELHLIEQVENIHLSKENNAFWEINGKSLTQNEAVTYFSTLITKTERLREQTRRSSTIRRYYNEKKIQQEMTQELTDRRSYHAHTQNHTDSVQNLEELTHLMLDTVMVENTNLTEQEYAAYLNAINEKNVKLQQLLQENPPEKQPVNKVVVDRKQAIRQSLRALENPQEVLHEIYENSQAIKPEAPAVIRQYLALADETTRTAIEEIMGIAPGRKNQEEETEKQSIASVEQILQQEKERVERNLETMTHSGQVTREIRNLLVRYTEQVDEQENRIYYDNTILDRASQIVKEEDREKVVNLEKHVLELVKVPIQQLEVEKQESTVTYHQLSQTEVTRMVHKEKQQLRDEIKEEVLQSIDRMQVNKTQEIDYQQVENITQKQIEETKREIIKRQQETIQEIVNRNLITQMGSISDKVYKDIERKLQGERRRRGY